MIGHTLGLLGILRPSFMRRTLFIAFVLAMLGVSAADGSPVHGTRPRRQATVPVSASHKKAGRAATAARDRAAGDRAAAAGDRTADDAAANSTGHSATRATVHKNSRAAARAATRKNSRAAAREAERDSARPRARDRETQPPSRRSFRSRSRAKSYQAAEYRTADLRSSASFNSAARPRRASESYRAAKFSLTSEPRAPEHSAAETGAARPSAAVQAASLREERIAMPPPLLGSFTSLARQNERTEADGLERIEDEADLNDRISRKMLVPVPVTPALGINGNLPVNRRYCRPWAATFLASLALAHAARFHRSLEVSSAVRTVEYQKQLAKVNGNAAAAEGDIASPHLTGAAIDIAKKGLSEREIGWLRAWLLPLQEAGKIDVEEEFQQACFHITVYKNYAAPERRAQPAESRPQQATNSPSPSSSF